MTLTRRQWLGTAAGASALIPAVALAKKAPTPAPVAAATTPAKGAGTASTPLPPGGHVVQPLPFDPTKLSGLSDKMLVSHHDNNYASAVKNLNKVEEALAQVNKDTPGFTVSSLRERELTYTNSLVLHEHYFANLGGNGKPSGNVEKAIAQAHGGLARWEELFRATAMSLGGGSGWVVLDLSFATGDLRTYGLAGHQQSPAFAAPLLVLDMFEHAYAMDFGAAHAKYIDAFMANVKWEAVDARLERARKAAQALRG